jgi:hypothetical protein
MCHQLRVEALRQAQVEGIAVRVSPENAVSCYLLALENRELVVFSLCFVFVVSS